MPASCAGLGTLLSTAAVALLVLVNIGQIRVGQTVPRHIRLISVSTADLGNAVGALAGGTVPGLYGDAHAAGNDYPANSGLRTYYSWGLWNRCGGYGSPSDLQFCTPTQFAHNFEPLTQVFQRDPPAAAVNVVTEALPDSTITANNYLGRFTRVAFYFIFIGSLLAALSMLLGLGAHRFAFLFGALTASFALASILVGAIIWTVLTVRVKAAVNDAAITGGLPLGIVVSYGNALWMLWGAAAALLLSILPYIAACCTGRQEDKNYY